MSNLVEFTKSEQPDVLCLQEANGWGDDGQNISKEFAEKVGLLFYAYGDSNTKYDLATFSHLPFKESKVYKDEFWHCAVRTTIQYEGTALGVWNVHLDPREEERRLIEAGLISSRIGKFDKAIILGDFNSLSAVDGYGEELARRLARSGITKFGNDGLRYEVMSYFAKQGFVDAAEVFGVKDWTVPTPVNTDPYHLGEMRLDYALVAPGLALGSHSIRSYAIKNEMTDGISDHYPIVIVIE